MIWFGGLFRFMFELLVACWVKLIHRYNPKYSRFTGSSIRNAQAQGNYFRKVIRSPRPTNFAQEKVNGNYKYTPTIPSKENSRVRNKDNSVIKYSSTGHSKYGKFDIPYQQLNLSRETRVRPNVTLDISQNYYGTNPKLGKADNKVRF